MFAAHFWFVALNQRRWLFKNLGLRTKYIAARKISLGTSNIPRKKEPTFSGGTDWCVK
jgi:hypothetical protein